MGAPGRVINQIPTLVKLPCRYRITVKQIIPTKMKEMHGEFYDGIWDDSTRTIYLNKRIDHKRKWYVFAHELAHAVNDWLHWLLNEEIAKA